jgi:hypothetical protein
LVNCCFVWLLVASVSTSLVIQVSHFGLFFG